MILGFVLRLVEEGVAIESHWDTIITMYNPAHLDECEKEKKINRRKFIDAAMLSVGIIASLSSIPQVLKIYQTQDVAGISLITYLIALASVVAWFLYGLYIKNKPLIYSTSIAMVINIIVIFQIITTN